MKKDEKTNSPVQCAGMQRAIEMTADRIRGLMERRERLAQAARKDYASFFERQSEELYEVCHELGELNRLLRGPLRYADPSETARTLDRRVESMTEELVQGDVERCVNLPMMRRAFLLQRKVSQKLVRFYTSLILTITADCRL